MPGDNEYSSLYQKFTITRSTFIIDDYITGMHVLWSTVVLHIIIDNLYIRMYRLSMILCRIDTEKHGRHTLAQILFSSEN